MVSAGPGQRMVVGRRRGLGERRYRAHYGGNRLWPGVPGGAGKSTHTAVSARTVIDRLDSAEAGGDGGWRTRCRPVSADVAPARSQDRRRCGAGPGARSRLQARMEGTAGAGRRRPRCGSRTIRCIGSINRAVRRPCWPPRPCGSASCAIPSSCSAPPPCGFPRLPASGWGKPGKPQPGRGAVPGHRSTNLNCRKIFRLPGRRSDGVSEITDF